MAKLRMNQAIALAIAEEMERDSRVVMFGEDIAVAEGPFKTSEGLLKQFGPSRVRDTPISEMGFLGAAVGAAATGLRPVVEIMFIEFLGVALDQLVTEGAMMHYLSGGRLTVPAHGARVGRFRPWFRMPALPDARALVARNAGPESWPWRQGPRSAYGLIKAAIRDENPVVVLETRSLYGQREDFEPNEDAVIPLGVGEVLREGTDVTIVALGQTVGLALAAAEASKELVGRSH
jgi:pyruvate/2-oxoglutarate/acetoin dehydrogenase E1 component